MEKELVAIEQDGVEVESEHIKVTPYAITFAGSPTIEEWHKAVLGVQKINSMTQFYLGDLMVYAESPVTGWGQGKYQDLIEQTGYDYSSLTKFARVARRFTPDFRKRVLENLSLTTNVSFTHFDEVASLGDIPAKHFLEQVATKKWSVAKLREEVQRYKSMKPDVDDEPVETPVGYTSFKDVGKNLLKGYVPQQPEKEYDEVAWLLEIRDWADARLHELGVEA